MDEPFNKKDNMKQLSAALDGLVSQIDAQLEARPEHPAVAVLERLKQNLIVYPAMYESVLDNAVLVQGAIHDMGAEEFTVYAELFSALSVMKQLGIIDDTVLVSLMVELMKFCLAKGILYGIKLGKSDDNIFSSFVNEEL